MWSNVSRSPVRENPCATEKDSWPLSREFEGIGFHMTGDGNFPCRRRSEQSDRMETTFFCVHPCSARNSEHLENGIGRGVTICMTCTEAFLIVGFSLLGRCSELREQKRKNKSFTSYETCAITFISSERSGMHCLHLTLSCGRSISVHCSADPCPCDMLLFPCDTSPIAA